METCYTLNDVAMMTGLTTRTLRNYLKMDVLKGTKVDGVWKFTERELMDVIENPWFISFCPNRKELHSFCVSNK